MSRAGSQTDAAGAAGTTGLWPISGRNPRHERGREQAGNLSGSACVSSRPWEPIGAGSRHLTGIFPFPTPIGAPWKLTVFAGGVRQGCGATREAPCGPRWRVANSASADRAIGLGCQGVLEAWALDASLCASPEPARLVRSIARLRARRRSGRVSGRPRDLWQHRPQVLTFSCSGDQLVVDTTVDVACGCPIFTLYHQDARYREVWQAIVSSGLRPNRRQRQDAEVWARRWASASSSTGRTGAVRRRMAVPTIPGSKAWLAGRSCSILSTARCGGWRWPMRRGHLQVGGREIMARKYLVSGDLD